MSGASSALYLAIAMTSPSVASGESRRPFDGEVLVAAGLPRVPLTIRIPAPSGPYARLEEFRRYETGWDGENAPPPNEVALEMGARVVAALIQEEVSVSRVAPDADGGVAIYVFAKAPAKAYAAFHCTNDGEILFLRSDVGKPADVSEINEDALASAAQTAWRFVMAARAHS